MLLALSSGAFFPFLSFFLFRSPCIHCLKGIKCITDRRFTASLYRFASSFLCVYLCMCVCIYLSISQTESLRALAREQLQMWVTDTVRQGGGPAGTAGCREGWCGVSVCVSGWVCVCVYQGGSRLTLGGGGNMCRRFDLWGSEHDNYYLPSKRLTTALRASKLLFPFYYIISPMTSGSYTLTPGHAPPSQSETPKCCAALVRNDSEVPFHARCWNLYVFLFLTTRTMQYIRRCHKPWCKSIHPLALITPLGNNGRGI